MIRHLPRRAAVAASAVAAALLLAGCGIGRSSETTVELPAIQGSSAQVNGIALRDFLVVPAGSGGALVGTIVDAGSVTDTLTSITTSGGGSVLVAASAGTASTSATFSAAASPVTSASASASASPSARQHAGSTAKPATTPRASATATASASASPASSPSTAAVTLHPGDVVRFVQPGQPGLSAALSGGAALLPGTTVAVTFTFATSGPVTLQVPVWSNPGTTATSTPLPSESPVPSPTQGQGVEISQSPSGEPNLPASAGTTSP